MTVRARLRSAGARARAVIDLAWHAHRWALFAYVALHAASSLLPVATAWMTKVVLDRLAAGTDGAPVVTAAGGLVATGLAVATLPPAVRFLQAELDRGMAVQAKDRLYQAVARIPFLSTLETPSFRDQLRLAEQASRTGPGQVISSGLGAAQSTLTAAGLVASLAVIAPMMAAVLVAAAVPSLLAEVRLGRRRAQVVSDVSPGERRELFYAELLTSLSAAKEIRLFGAERLFRHRMLRELAATHAERRRVDCRDAGVQLLLAALSAVTAGGGLVWIVLRAADGRLSIGDVGAVLVAAGSLQSSLAAAVDHIAAGHFAGLLVDHYRALLRSSPATVPAAATRPRLTTPARGIELAGVWFRYGDDGPWALRGVDLDIPEGEAIALVGENGSGKSTLIKLLCRLYEPTRGSIRWHGVDLRDLDIAELRGRIGVVFQDFMSYDLTVAENIAVGNVDGRSELDLAPEGLVGAARRAGVHDTVVALPSGYETLLSRTFVDYARQDDAGVLLSGGQWQRLALARTLLRSERELLLFDEPSSGLDAGAEHCVHREIARHRRGRTSVLVSHRLNTVRDVDRIVVLAGGHVSEQGTHEDLCAADGAYARLFRLQAAGYQPVEARL